MQKTNIEYLDITCNPIAMRCTRVSKSCENCWHLAMCDRLKNNPKIPMDLREVYAGDRPPVLIQSRLDTILRRKEHAVIGIQFMGDLWHEDIPHLLIDDVFDVMTAARQHTFIVLTKRPENLLKWYNETITLGGGDYLSNLWLGVSVEDQATADERLPILLQIPAAVHIVSYEPALSAIKIPKVWLRKAPPLMSGKQQWNTISWIIAGCESGSNHRPAKVNWLRDVKNQCVEADVPFFLKQMDWFGNITKMPILDGYVWDQIPKGMTC